MLSLQSGISSEIQPIIYPEILYGNISSSQELFVVPFTHFYPIHPYLVKITIGIMRDAVLEIKDYELKVLGIGIEILIFRKVKYHVSLSLPYLFPFSSIFLPLELSLILLFFNINTTQLLSSLLRAIWVF